MATKRQSPRHRTRLMLTVGLLSAVTIALGAASAGTRRAPAADAAGDHPAAPAMSRAISAPTSRSAHAAARLLDGRVLITGGFSDLAGHRTVLDTAEIFNPADESAQPVAARMKSSRAFHQATLIESGPARGKVLITGGFSTVALDRLMSAEIFDPVHDTFTAVAAPMATARAGHQAMFLPDTGQVRVSGGSVSGGAIRIDGRTSQDLHFEGGTLTPAVETFDPRSGSFTLVNTDGHSAPISDSSWSTKARMNAARSPASARPVALLMVSGSRNSLR